jgi:hypothetical protein
MLTEEYLILVDNPIGKMVFGDNLQDGYSTTFELIPLNNPYNSASTLRMISPKCSSFSGNRFLSTSITSN